MNIFITLLIIRDYVQTYTFYTNGIDYEIWKTNENDALLGFDKFLRRTAMDRIVLQ